MAQKRMFNQQIVDSDAFLDMSKDAQNLYFHLSMRADDDGLISNSKRIMRSIGATELAYDELGASRFIIQLPNGIIAIKHWCINNDIKNDRYHSTKYTEEFSLLIKKNNGSYTEDIPKWIRLGYKMDTERILSIDKSSIDIDKNSINTYASNEAKTGDKTGDNLKLIRKGKMVEIKDLL